MGARGHTPPLTCQPWNGAVRAATPPHRATPRSCPPPTNQPYQVRRVVLCGYTATPDELQVQQTTMGAHAYVAWEWAATAEAAVQALRARGTHVVALETAPSLVHHAVHCTVLSVVRRMAYRAFRSASHGEATVAPCACMAPARHVGNGRHTHTHTRCPPRPTRTSMISRAAAAGLRSSWATSGMAVC